MADLLDSIVSALTALNDRQRAARGLSSALVSPFDEFNAIRLPLLKADPPASLSLHFATSGLATAVLRVALPPRSVIHKPQAFESRAIIQIDDERGAARVLYLPWTRVDSDQVPKIDLGEIDIMLPAEEVRDAFVAKFLAKAETDLRAGPTLVPTP